MAERMNSIAFEEEQSRRILEDRDEEFFDYPDSQDSGEEDFTNNSEHETESEQSFDDSEDDPDWDDRPSTSQATPAKRPRCRTRSQGPSPFQPAQSASSQCRVRCFLSGKDGTQWFMEPQEREKKIAPLGNQDITASIPEAAQSAKSPISSWSLFISDSMIKKIVEYSNMKLEKMRAGYSRSRDANPTDEAEMKAVLAFLYLAGLHNSGHTNVSDLWADDGTGLELCRLSMTERRFRQLLCAVRFDSIDVSDRERRLKIDKMTKIREIFEAFNSNCKRNYNLSDRVTIDEMLESFRGNCGFKQYMPKKPSKYGIKIFALCDAKTYYTSNLEVYVGNQPEGSSMRQSNSPTDVVLRLANPIFGSGRNITVDNWFTNYDLAEKLAEKKLSLIGTIRKNKRFIPPTFLKEKEFKTPNSSLFAFNNLATLVAYMGKNKKIVPLLSTLPEHNNNKTVSEKENKPVIITEYNATKGGVDQVDRLKVSYSIARSSRRWTLTLFFSILNIAGINGHIIFNTNSKSFMSRRVYLKNIIKELLYDQARRRATTQQLQPMLRDRIDFLFPLRPQDELTSRPSRARAEGRCYLDTWKENRLSTVTCHRWFGLPSSHLHGPSFIEEPPVSVDFTNSSGAIINCRGQGNPPPDIKWIDGSNKEILTMPRLRETLNNGSLYFWPFSLNDFRSEIHQMTYKCVLSNIVGSVVSRECKIRADVIYAIDIQVSNVYVIKGNVAMLKCTAPPSIRTNLFAINWMKDDPQEGRSIITPGGRYVQTNTGELHIRDVTSHDSTVRYYCQLTNKLTDERYFSQPGHIIVSEAENVVTPKIEHSSSNIQAREGDSVDLICVAQAYPPPVYRWYHEVAGSLQEIRSGAAVFVRPQLSVLQFPRVQASDSSLYVCMVSNNVGEDRKEMKLAVSTALIAFIRPQKQVVDSTSQAVFNCSVQGGVGDTTIYWLKDGNRIYDSHNIETMHRGETLVLRSVGRNDSGMYQCYAQNHDETAQAAAELILGDVSPEFQDTFIEETLQPGLPVSLRCIANGNPPPRINWYLDGGQIQAGDGFFIGTFLDSKGNVVGHLNISSVRLEHGGLYSCEARNFLGVVEHSAMLNIYGPPTSRQPLNLTAVSGTSIRLRCPVSGFPITSTTWYSGNEAITDQMTRKLYNNGTLLLTSLEEERDKGKYTCTVYNQQGMMSTGVVFLNIMAPPEIMPIHSSSNLKEGGKTNLVCSVTSGDSPITFAWRKDGKPLPHDPDIHEHGMDMVSTLIINNLAARHTGQYTCIATNPAASANFSVRLIVKASPIWSIEPQDTTILYQHSVVINCQASGFPSPRITWTKSKEKKPSDFVPLESNTRLFIYGNGSIEIKNAERQHEGYYECQADNGIGAPISKTIFLKVNIPAHFRVKHVNHSGIAGHSIVLSCEAEGEGPIGITWNTSPGAQVFTKQTSNSVISELHLEYLTRRHAGVYRCTATNRFGQDYMAIYLSVKEPPESPQNVEVIEAGSRWLKINWTSAFNDNMYYIIQFRSLHENTWSNLTMPNSAQVSVIETLVPNTVYLVRVIAVNEVGRSKPSIDITARTLQEAPSGHPTDIAVEKVNIDAITIRWKVLSPEFWNGELLGYRVFYSENNRNSNSKSRTIRNVDANRAIIHNLRAYTTYDINIRAFNQIGEGPFSPALTVTTLESTPTSAPQNVHCSASSPESLRVRWDRPPPQHWNGVLQGYKISYQHSNPKPGVKVYTEYKKTSSLETIIHGLEKYTNYSIRVLATTNAGDGVQSSHVQCVTMEDVPGAPDEIKALVMSSDSVMLVWNAPKEPGGKILKYNVYVQSDGEEPRKESVFGDEATRHIFRQLTEYRKYEFWITASTIIGEGQSSMKVSQVLTSQIPAKISSFSKTVIGVAGSHLTLECNAVGLPTPSCVWKKIGASLPMESKILLDKSLWISELRLEDAGNYTCNAENVYGSDRVTYDVIVVQVPVSPTLQLASSTKQAISLKWKNHGDGGSPILGHVIFAHTENEELSIFVDADQTSHTVTNLKCGTKYSFNIETLNSIGRSKKSNTVQARTKGEVPEFFNDNELFFVNSTSVTLFLDGWPERECPIQYFSIMYKLNDNWIPVGRGHILPQPTTISNLIPATLYSIKVTAYNEAGKISQNFVVITRALNGEIIPIELVDQSQVSLISQLNFIIPVVSGIICLISLIVCAVILIRRRKIYAQYKSGETTLNNSRAELENPPNNHPPQILHQNTYSPARVMRKNSALSMHKDNIDDYDVYPYATFTVPSQLQTFTQRDCNDGNLASDNTHSLQRKRKSSTKNSTDTLSLEIACISNQQTLPIGRKTTFGVMTTAFNDSDSTMNPTSRHKKHYIKRNADISHDSSTESAEVSPETTRRPRGRHGPTSRDHSKPAKLQKSFSNGCEISEPESDQNVTDKSCSKLLQHEKFNQELSSIVNEYRKRRIKRDDYDMIHV